MAAHVLDSSAVLAWLRLEDGAETVRPLIADGVISAPNWSEILQKVSEQDRDANEVGNLLKTLGVTVALFAEEDAAETAALWPVASNLSLADRACLALARRLDVPAVTADRFWSGVDVGVDIRLIR